MDKIILLDTQIDANTIQSFFTLDHIKELLTQFGDWSVKFLLKAILAYIIWKVGKKVVKVILGFYNKAVQKKDLDVGVAKFFGSMIKVILYAVLLLMVIDMLGIQTTSLLTIFGSAALAIGMSLQGSLSNFAGGILLLVFHPFTIGDYIISGENEGTVVSVELLYTRLRTVDNKVVMLPNGKLANSSIINVGAENMRRIDIEIGIGYGSDVNKAKEILKGIIKNTAEIRKDKDIKVVVKRLDESCVTLETRAWVEQDKYWDVRFSLLEEYKAAFDKDGIEIPFNQLDVHVKNDQQAD